MPRVRFPGVSGYAIENAVFQWEEGERALRSRDEQAQLERTVATIVDELRRRLGSAFTLAELADLYAYGTDWASVIAGGADDAAAIVDAAFARYARGAADYAATHPGWRRAR